MYDEIELNLNSNVLFPKITMPSSQRKAIQELFQNFHDTYTGEEFDWGNLLGRKFGEVSKKIFTPPLFE